MSAIVAVLIFLYLTVLFFEPNIEKNEETGEYLLFYSDIFSNFERKYITLW
jgi:hypothetical protein